MTERKRPELTLEGEKLYEDALQWYEHQLMDLHQDLRQELAKIYEKHKIEEQPDD